MGSDLYMNGKWWAETHYDGAMSALVEIKAALEDDDTEKALWIVNEALKKNDWKPFG